MLHTIGSKVSWELNVNGKTYKHLGGAFPVPAFAREMLGSDTVTVEVIPPREVEGKTLPRVVGDVDAVLCSDGSVVGIIWPRGQPTTMIDEDVLKLHGWEAMP